jgi:uncharacterized protein YndB with AHSA1/START domain
VKADIDITQRYPYPIDKMWHALTSREALAAWLMANDFAPKVGHRFTFTTKSAPGFDGTVHCEVVDLDPPTRMVWSWTGGPIDTMVTFTLTAHGPNSTELRLHQVGFHGLSGHLVRLLLARGFAKQLNRHLPAYLAQPERPTLPHP